MRLTPKKLICSLLLMLLPLGLNTLQADTPIKALLEYGQVDGFIDAEGRGVGYEILIETISRLKRDNIHIELKYLPFKRVIRDFLAGNADIAYPIINGGTFEQSGFAMWGFEKIPSLTAMEG